jgi:cGMP-dependent protein kinase
VSAEGEFEVFVGTKKVLTFGPGRAFGELAILYNTKRNATIQGKGTVSRLYVRPFVRLFWLLLDGIFTLLNTTSHYKKSHKMHIFKETPSRYFGN